MVPLPSELLSWKLTASVCLIPLAAWMLLSGLDDLFITLVYWLGRRRFTWPSKTDLESAPERRIAILLPLWQEFRVIGQMVERNLSVIEYGNYDIFAGVYPNDEQTGRVVRELAARHRRIHVTVCPHDGPTSKGDCLNWVYRRMEAYEEQHGIRFDVVMTHDAEDVIHPESLRLVSWYSREYEMVQVPVLPLPTGIREFTHGLYCDEFAEYQSKDIPVRQRLGGFLPSNGVGTGFAREALEALAATRDGRIFDPQCLTEDYDNGFRLFALGFRQIFLPLRFEGNHLTATREYFPRHLKAAIRQRSRWVAGIVLQGWQHFGWRVPASQIYWFWRDRKGLVGNLVTPAANLLFLYGLTAAVMGRYADGWPSWGGAVPGWLAGCYMATMGIAALQMAVRMRCCARVYGWRFAMTVPLRMPWANLVNSTATLAAIKQFLQAHTRRRPVAWLKTEHIYPSAARKEAGRPRLGDVLVKMRAAPVSAIEEALVSGRNGLRLGEYLVKVQKISEEDLYQALSCQAGLPLGLPERSEISSRITRMFPAELVKRWKVLPYRVQLGQLHVVTPELPSEEMTQALAACSDLEFRFHLVKPAEFDLLARRYVSVH